MNELEKQDFERFKSVFDTIVFTLGVKLENAHVPNYEEMFLSLEKNELGLAVMSFEEIKMFVTTYIDTVKSVASYVEKMIGEVGVEVKDETPAIWADFLSVEEYVVQHYINDYVSFCGGGT